MCIRDSSFPGAKFGSTFAARESHFMIYSEMSHPFYLSCSQLLMYQVTLGYFWINREKLTLGTSIVFSTWKRHLGWTIFVHFSMFLSNNVHLLSRVIRIVESNEGSRFLFPIQVWPSMIRKCLFNLYCMVLSLYENFPVCSQVCFLCLKTRFSLFGPWGQILSLIHISEPTRPY